MYTDSWKITLKRCYFQLKLFGITLDGNLDRVSGNNVDQLVDNLNANVNDYINAASLMTNELDIETTMTSLLDNFSYDSSNVKGVVVSFFKVYFL